MSLYARYNLEREGAHTLEKEYGFAKFKVLKDELYLIDMYIVPEHRRGLKSVRLVQEVEAWGRDCGCKTMTTTVVAGTPGADYSLMCCLKYGFSVGAANNSVIMLFKEIN